jgi:hypothetical protein
VEQIEADGLLLLWECGPEEAFFEGRPAGQDSEPSARGMSFRLNVADLRLRVGLAMPPTARIFDVSTQPSIFEQVLGRDRESRQPGSPESIVAHWIAAFAEVAGAWCPADPTWFIV